MDRLGDDSWALPAEALAVRLLGCTLRRTLDTGERLAGVIVETEAYTGPEDLASHAAGGRRTARNASMWAKPGTAYVYFTYGMHHCMNVSCLRGDHPAAVLIRAIVPIEGIETMRRFRTGEIPRKRALRDRDLCDGPGKLCRAMVIDRGLDGEDLATSPRLTILDRAPGLPEPRVEASPRVGLGDVGVLGAWKVKPLRFVWADHGMEAGSLAVRGEPMAKKRQR